DLAVLRPAVVPALAWTRNRIEGPEQLAVVGIVCFDAAANADLGTREARDDHAVVIERCARERKAFLPTLGLNGPHLFSGALIERDDAPVEHSREDLALADTHPAARPTAADRSDRGVELRGVLPQDRARLDRQREHVVGAGDDVDDAVVHERLRLARELRRDTGAVQVRAPNAFELRHVAAIDAVERRIALIEEIAAVRAPPIG